MTHVTDRRGSPQTLVCTKTRRHHQQRCDQHARDCAAMSALISLLPKAGGDGEDLAVRLKAATQRQARAT